MDEHRSSKIGQAIKGYDRVAYDPYLLVEGVAVDGWQIGLITGSFLEPEGEAIEPDSWGDTYVVAPDNQRAGVGAASLIIGELVVDPDAGTAIIEDGRRFRVRWPPGYVGRREGNEIQILDGNSVVIAETGMTMTLGGGSSEAGVWETCHGLIK